MLPPIKNEIVIAELSSSEHLFEDHKENGFVGVNEQLFSEKGFSATSVLNCLNSVSGMNWRMKQKVPLSGTQLEVFERQLLREDVDYAKTLGISADDLLETGLFPWESRLAVLLKDSIKPSEIPPAGWTADNVRPQIKAPVYETIDELLANRQARLVFPIERLPVIGSTEAGTNTVGIYLGFIEGRSTPVIIKLFPEERRSFLSDNETELQKAQMFSNLGIGPEFYGIVQVPVTGKDGKQRMAFGFAMQPVVIDETAPESEIDDVANKDYRKILSRSSKIGLTTGTPVKTVQGGRMSIDAGNAMLIDPSDYNAYIAASKDSGTKPAFIEGLKFKNGRKGTWLRRKWFNGGNEISLDHPALVEDYRRVVIERVRSGDNVVSVPLSKISPEYSISIVFDLEGGFPD